MNNLAVKGLRVEMYTVAVGNEADEYHLATSPDYPTKHDHSDPDGVPVLAQYWVEALYSAQIQRTMNDVV